MRWITLNNNMLDAHNLFLVIKSRHINLRNYNRTLQCTVNISYSIVQRYQFDINIYLIILHICVSSGIKVILKIQWIRYNYNKKFRILIWIALAFCKRVLSNIFWVCCWFSWHPDFICKYSNKQKWVVMRWIDHNTHIDIG